jgi:predicted transcriptional regulator
MKTRSKKTRMQITLTPEAHDMLEVLANARGLSCSTMLEQLIRERIQREEKERDR